MSKRKCFKRIPNINARFCCVREKKEQKKENTTLNAKLTASAAPYKPKKIPVARTVSKSTRHMMIYMRVFCALSPRKESLKNYLGFPNLIAKERSRH